MIRFPIETIHRYGIISHGGPVPSVVDQPLRINALLAEAKGFVDRWVNARVAADLKRGRIIHVFHADDKGRVFANVAANWLDYGHFSVLGTEKGFDACWQAYHVAHGSGCEAFDFRRFCKPRPLANATLVITSDGQMALVRRSKDLHLHPGFLHCNGGKVQKPEDGASIDLLQDALQRVHSETAIPLEQLEQWTYLGLCHNNPFDEVIALFAVRTTLTAEQVTAVYAQAQDPDGGVEWFDDNPQTIQVLLEREGLTPSFETLLFLLQRRRLAPQESRENLPLRWI